MNMLPQDHIIEMVSITNINLAAEIGINNDPITLGELLKSIHVFILETHVEFGTHYFL